MPTPFSETFYGYRFNGVVDRDSKALHDGPLTLRTEEDLVKFIHDNVEKYPELRVTDGGDQLVMHVVEQQLLFPIEPYLQNNRWHPEHKQFKPV